MDTVYLNGDFIDKQQASISILDRGFLFGDGVYEVIPTHNGLTIGAIPHLDRLNQSLNKIGLEPVLSHKQWQHTLKILQQQNQLEGQSISFYIQVTRGSTGFRSHSIPQNPTPTVVAFCMPLKHIDYSKGHKAITLQDTRHDICAIKSINLLSNILLYQQAQQQGAIEAILYRNHRIVEGSSSNVFSVHQGIITTPPLEDYILAGITRAFTIEAIGQLQLPFEERAIELEEFKQADEIWITSSSRSLLPITLLDNQPVGNGHVGNIIQKVQKKLSTIQLPRNNNEST